MQKNRRNMASYVFEFLTSRDWYRPVPSRTFPLLVWHSLACVCRVQTPLSSLGMKQLGASLLGTTLRADHRAKQTSYVPILRLMLERVLQDVHLTYSIGQGQ
jgi:hypothetical protein